MTLSHSLRAMAAAILVCGIAACSATQLQNAQSTVATVSADVLATVQAACSEYQPVAAAAAAVPNATVANLVKYGNSVCPPAGGVAAGAPIDTSTAAWAGAIKGAIAALAQAPSASPAKPSGS